MIKAAFGDHENYNHAMKFGGDAFLANPLISMLGKRN
jgi:hypothetical protein